MKQLLYICFITLLSSCIFIPKGEKGSGNITSEERSVSSFNKIDIESIVDVIIIPSTKEKVVVEIDDNLQKYIKVSTTDNKLKIKMNTPNHELNNKSGKIYIYIDEVVKINNSCVGSLKNEDVIKAADFTFINSAVGSTKLNIEATNISIDNSAVGRTQFAGQCENLKIKNSAVGSFEAKELHGEILNLENSGVGTTSVYADNEIYIHNSAIGSLNVYGECEIKEIDNNGIGRFKKH